MKKTVSLIAFHLIFISSFSQGYIVTWAGDTVTVTLPSNPRKAGLARPGQYTDGHKQIAVLFPGDSLRIIKAGDVKGYYRKTHGKDLLCNGNFESRKLNEKDRWLLDGARKSGTGPWCFMNRVVDGEYACLYVVYSRIGNSTSRHFFLKRNGAGDSSLPVLLFTKKKLKQLLMDPDIAGEMKESSYRKGYKGYYDLVNTYNRLKEKAKKL